MARGDGAGSVEDALSVLVDVEDLVDGPPGDCEITALAGEHGPGRVERTVLGAAGCAGPGGSRPQADGRYESCRCNSYPGCGCFDGYVEHRIPPVQIGAAPASTMYSRSPRAADMRRGHQRTIRSCRQDEGPVEGTWRAIAEGTETAQDRAERGGSGWMSYCLKSGRSAVRPRP